MQLFGSDVAVAVLEKQLRQGKPLSRRPQTGLAQPPEGGGEWRSAFHAVDMGRRDPKANTGIAGLRCATEGRRCAAIESCRGALGKGTQGWAGRPASRTLQVRLEVAVIANPSATGTEGPLSVVRAGIWLRQRTTGMGHDRPSMSDEASGR